MTTTFAQILDEQVGPLGTPERDKFEADVKAEVRRLAKVCDRYPLATERASYWAPPWSVSPGRRRRFAKWRKRNKAILAGRGKRGRL